MSIEEVILSDQCLNKSLEKTIPISKRLPEFENSSLSRKSYKRINTGNVYSELNALRKRNLQNKQNIRHLKSKISKIVEENQALKNKTKRYLHSASVSELRVKALVKKCKDLKKAYLLKEQESNNEKNVLRAMNIELKVKLGECQAEKTALLNTFGQCLENESL